LLKTLMRPLTATRNWLGRAAPMLSGGTAPDSASVAPVKLVPTLNALGPASAAPIVASFGAGEPGFGFLSKSTSRSGSVRAGRWPRACCSAMISAVVRSTPGGPVHGVPMRVSGRPAPPPALPLDGAPLAETTSANPSTIEPAYTASSPRPQTLHVITLTLSGCPTPLTRRRTIALLPAEGKCSARAGCGMRRYSSESRSPTAMSPPALDDAREDAALALELLVQAGTQRFHPLARIADHRDLSTVLA
jgi:hypothetical protein